MVLLLCEPAAPASTIHTASWPTGTFPDMPGLIAIERAVGDQALMNERSVSTSPNNCREEMQWASVCAFINEVNHNPKRQQQWPSEAVKLIQDLDRMLAEVFHAAPNLKPQSRAVYDNTRKKLPRTTNGSNAANVGCAVISTITLVRVPRRSSIGASSPTRASSAFTLALPPLRPYASTLPPCVSLAMALSTPRASRSAFATSRVFLTRTIASHTRLSLTLATVPTPVASRGSSPGQF